MMDSNCPGWCAARFAHHHPAPVPNWQPDGSFGIDRTVIPDQRVPYIYFESTGEASYGSATPPEVLAVLSKFSFQAGKAPRWRCFRCRTNDHDVEEHH